MSCASPSSDAPADDRVGTIAFGATAAAEDPPRPRSELARPSESRSAATGRTSRPRSAGRSPRSLPTRRHGSSLVTTGSQTRGDALAAAAAAVAADVPVDVVVLEQKVVPRRAGRRLSCAVDAPTIDEPFDLRVVTSSAARDRRRDSHLGGMTARLRDRARARRAPARTSCGSARRLRAPGSIATTWRSLRSIPLPTRPPTTTRAARSCGFAAPALALVLEGDAGTGAPVAQRSRPAGSASTERSHDGRARRRRRARGLRPRRPQRRSRVAISRRRSSTRSRLRPRSRRRPAPHGGRPLDGTRRVRAHAHRGGVAGRLRSQAGEATGLARRGDRHRLLRSMGAMVGGHTKLELANEAAARRASLLGPGRPARRRARRHRGAMDGALSPVNDPDALGEAIRSVGVGGGGIYTDLALSAGYEALARESVNLKHLLLFADGSDAEQITGLPRHRQGRLRPRDHDQRDLARPGHDSPELEALSKVGGGRFYLIEDATKLPAVFTQETILAARSAIHEDPFRASPGLPRAATRGHRLRRRSRRSAATWSRWPSRARASRSRGPRTIRPRDVERGNRARRGVHERLQGPVGTASGSPGPAAAKLFGQLGRDLARKARRSPRPPRGRRDRRRAARSSRRRRRRRPRADVPAPDRARRGSRRLLGTCRSRRWARVATRPAPAFAPGTYVATAKDEATGSPWGRRAPSSRGEKSCVPRAAIARCSRASPPRAASSRHARRPLR